MKKRTGNKLDFWWQLIDADNGDFEKVFPNTRAILPNGIVSTQPSRLVWDWDLGRDHAAFAYEILRRADRESELARYPDISPDESQFLLRVFGKARKIHAPLCIHLDLTIKLEPGYSLPATFRLDAPDNTLKLAFIDFINWQRKLKCIAPRKTLGNTSQKPPWHYIELLDEKDLFGKNPDDDTGKRNLRKARLRAKEYFKTFVFKLKNEAGKNSKSRSYLWPKLQI